MDVQTPQPSVTLISHNYRGIAQTIRYVLLYLNQPFEEILLKHGQTLASLEVMKRRKVPEESELPCLIDGDLVITNFFAILRHLCSITNRQDLLGQNLEQKTLVKEIFYNLMVYKKRQIKMLYGFAERAVYEPEKREEIRKIAMQRCHQSSQSVIPLAKLKLRAPYQKYILGHITLLDFLFFEQSFYQINMFGNLEEKNCAILETINSIFNSDFSSLKQKSSIYLKVMREFRQSFQKETFFEKNKQKLDSYSPVCQAMGNFAKQAFRKVWVGSDHYFK